MSNIAYRSGTHLPDQFEGGQFPDKLRDLGEEVVVQQDHLQTVPCTVLNCTVLYCTLLFTVLYCPVHQADLQTPVAQKRRREHDQEVVPGK